MVGAVLSRSPPFRFSQTLLDLFFEGAERRSGSSEFRRALDLS
jgi:hypothetical protein